MNVPLLIIGHLLYFYFLWTPVSTGNTSFSYNVNIFRAWPCRRAVSCWWWRSHVSPGSPQAPSPPGCSCPEAARTWSFDVIKKFMKNDDVTAKTLFCIHTWSNSFRFFPKQREISKPLLYLSNLALVKENVLGSSSQKSASSRWVKVPGGGSISATRALISSLTRDRDLIIMIINNKTKCLGSVCLMKYEKV